MAKGYEVKNGYQIMRFRRNETGYESFAYLIDTFQSPMSIYWYRIRQYPNHITVSYGKIRRS